MRPVPAPLPIRRGSWAHLALLALLALLATPAAASAGPLVGLEGAAPAATRLYLADPHYRGGILDLWEPQAAIEPVGGVATMGCLDVPFVGIEDPRAHTWYAVPFPGGRSDALRPTFHSAPGLWTDLVLDPQAPAAVHWYLEAEAPVPQVVVRAVVRTGDAVSVGDAEYNRGEVLAEGQTAPADLSPLLTDHPEVRHERVDGRDVYHFVVPLEVQAAAVPVGDGFNLRVDAFVQNPLCADPQWPEDHMVAPGALRLHGSPGRQPHLEWTVAEPLRPRFLVPHKVEDVWAIEARVTSPWGPHDLDVRLVVEGPGVRWETVPGAVHAYKGHGQIEGPLYVFAFDARAMPEGLYNATLTATNAQGTAHATARAAFHTDGRAWVADSEGLHEVVTERQAAAPGLPVAALLTGLTAVALAARAGGRSR